MKWPACLTSPAYRSPNNLEHKLTYISLLCLYPLQADNPLLPTEPFRINGPKSLCLSPRILKISPVFQYCTPPPFRRLIWQKSSFQQQPFPIFNNRNHTPSLFLRARIWKAHFWAPVRFEWCLMNMLQEWILLPKFLWPGSAKCCDWLINDSPNSKQ